MVIDLEIIKERICKAKEILEAAELLQDDNTKAVLYKAVVDLLETAAQDLRPAEAGGEDDE